MWPRCSVMCLRLWPGTHRTRLTYCAAVAGQLCKHTTAGKSAASRLEQPLVTSINITHWRSTGAPVHDYTEISKGRRAEGRTNIHTPRADGLSKTGMSWKTAVLETGFEISSLNCCWWFWPLPISPTAWPSLKPSVEVHMSTVSQGTWEICDTPTHIIPSCVWANVSATRRRCEITVQQGHIIWTLYESLNWNHMCMKNMGFGAKKYV